MKSPQKISPRSLPQLTTEPQFRAVQLENRFEVYAWSFSDFFSDTIFALYFHALLNTNDINFLILFRINCL